MQVSGDIVFGDAFQIMVRGMTLTDYDLIIGNPGIGLAARRSRR